LPRALGPKATKDLVSGEIILEPEEEMFRARLCGESLRLIAKRFGVSVATVERAVQERCTAITPANRQHALQLELERLEALWATFNERAQEGNEAAAAICLRISERRSSMWGLDCHAPAQPLLLVEAQGQAPSSTERILAALKRVTGRDIIGDGNGTLPVPGESNDKH
jgi:hypothetical protein